MRVHELATDLDVTIEELLEILSDVDIKAKDGQSLLADTEVAVVCDELGFASIDEARAASSRKKAPVIAAEVKPQPPVKPVVVEPPPVEDLPEDESSNVLAFAKPQIAVKELAEKIGVKPNQLIAELMKMNIFASINQDIDIKIAKQVGEKHGFIVELKKKDKPLPKPAEAAASKPVVAPVEKDRPEDLEIRPPIITFMGHVDHGKTSLLDRIRNTKVVASESGGITQHIGAYTVDMDARQITFLDTPGHAAFTAMRARGANVTDIAVLVVAADDGVMPQTSEAIKHAKAAGVCIIVAMNKMDLYGTNPDRIKQQLNEHGVMVEDWGGSVGCIPVSAITGAGIDQLLERITLEAEMLELRANPHKKATGFVIEARMEPGMGPTATLLVRDGTLKVGDSVLCGAQWGRIKALISDQGKQVRTAGPSHAVKCVGLTGVPGAGDEFSVCANANEARQMSEELLAEMKTADLNQNVRGKISLEDLFGKAGATEVKELNVILKCDVQGSVEAIVGALSGIKSDKVKLRILTSDVGNITTNDVMLASASNAIILGFHIAKEGGISAVAKKEGVEIRLYSIIYELLEEVEAAMCGLLDPELRETYLGKAEIRAIFDMGKRHKVAGCMVVEGKITSRASIRIKRGGEILYKGTIGSLKRFQSDAAEVRDGQECGIRPDNFSNFQEGDVIEAYTIEKITQKL
ncbi:MAG: translation initiation factor IF-2 [Kiritimatiellaceae bacterium]|nr:translation initiation factor IF-2 [Kiritimatiellaceae bacterium]